MDEISTNALAAAETARRKLNEAVEAYRRAEQYAFDNDDMGLAASMASMAVVIDAHLGDHDETLKARV